MVLEINMSDYPLRVLSLGAGVQSTTLFYMMLKGELPKPDHILFSDTGWEPEAVYKHVEDLRAMAQKAGIPFHTVSAGNIKDDFLESQKNFMPLYLKSGNKRAGMIHRQCTDRYKLRPLLKKTRELAGLKPRQRCKDLRVITIMGISWDESQRMRDSEFSWIQNEYPLVDLKMTRQNCIEWCEKNGFKKPPRSACLGCPFKKDTEWIELKKNEKEWKDAVAFDHALRTTSKPRFLEHEAYLHRSIIPLDQVKLKSDTNEQTSLFDQECVGMCGV